MFTADQLVAHAVGDYILQSDWMANEKTKRSIAALVHALTYSIPFLLITQSIPALLTIVGTHFVIDRWRLARFVVWAKNFAAPKHIPAIVERPDLAEHPDLFIPTGPGFVRNYPWSECSATGYYKDRPPFLAVWLLIITDNVMHVVINALAINWL